MNLHAPVRADAATTFVNAALVLPDGLAQRGALTVVGASIEAVEPEAATGTVIDCAGDVIMPGLVDVHTDHFEKHVFPRNHVRWAVMPAALAHDAQVIGGGTTTVFDSLSVGAATSNDDARRDILDPMIDALEDGTAAGMFRAEHLVHLRCETADDATIALLETNLHRHIVRLASVMDHTPGAKQSRDIAAYIDRRIAATGMSRAAVEAETEQIKARAEAIVQRVRHDVVTALVSTGLILMSHDDVTTAHVEEARADGITIAEFPTTLEAARAAKAAGMTVVAGAPNYLRGGSQAGNIAVAALLAEQLVDIFASDYVPRSILDAVFALAYDEALPFDLAAAARLATVNPARAAGLDDRGALLKGQRADILRVGKAGRQPFVRAAWREGVRVS